MSLNTGIFGESLPPGFQMKVGDDFHDENMANFSKLLYAKQYFDPNAGDGGGNNPPSQVTSDQMARWNMLIQFAKDKGYAGDPALDHDEKLRQKVFNEYNKANPDYAISIDAVKSIQQEIQNYKQQALANIKAHPESFPGKPEDFMKGISQVDNIFGQQTSQWAFPGAYLVDKQTQERKRLGFAPKVDFTTLK